MRFFSFLRTSSVTTDLPAPSNSPSPQADTSEQPTSSSNHRRYSKDSEGYPSWLPKRPPPPAPRSTFQSSNINLPVETPAPPEPVLPMNIGGRKPTPRSVRIVSLHDDYGEKAREPTDQTRVPSGPMHARAWSRATAPTVFSDPAVAGPFAFSAVLRPRFRAKGLNLDLVRSPGWGMKLFFYLVRIFIFMHIPLQTFLDFNVAFMLYQVARFPNPEAPGVPGSGRNWALATAAYAACWLFWILGVFLLYELVYSFVRRWRVKRPLIYPIYLSSPAFNFVSISSYTNFCFLYHIRFSPLKSNVSSDSSSDMHNVGSDSVSPVRPRSITTFLAETCSFYAQNLPTVALLLPRAGIALALLLAFTSPDPELVALNNANLGIGRDPTFFHQLDGTLTNYARGILWANVAWTGWKVLLLLCSWLGLLVLSGHPCAGLCGPRYHWEEEDAEKRASAFSTDHPDDASEQYREHDLLQWNWRNETRERIIEAWEFCLPQKHPRFGSGVGYNVLKGKDMMEQAQLFSQGTTDAYPCENMQQIFSAVGLAGASHPTKRGVLSDDFFRGPGGHSRRPSDQVEVVERTETPPELKPGSVERVPQVIRKKESKGKKPERYPYPFTAQGAQLSSEDSVAVPFPPSPRASDNGHAATSSGSPDDEDEEDEEDEGEGEGEGEEEEEDADVEEGEEGATGEPRTSGSMSSLGNPVSSRYPFQFRRPMRGGTNNSLSSGAYSHSQSNSHSMHNRSMHSRVSEATQSTGNRESTDSNSPRSRYTTSSGSMMSRGGTSSGSGPAGNVMAGLPMPPRHPRARARAGTVPLPSGQSSSDAGPVIFPRAAERERVRAESTLTRTFGVPPRHEPAPGQDIPQDAQTASDSEPDDEKEQEDGEEEDEVGLLSGASSRGPSPRTSLRHRTSSSSFVALRHRASNSFSQSLSHLHQTARIHRQSHGSTSASGSGSRSGSNSRHNSHSGSASSISVAVRSRAQSLMQSVVGAASHQSLEHVNIAIPGRRSRANSSMARLEEDVQADVSYSSTSDSRAYTHSRSGSGTGTGSASVENYTFGQPLPSQARPTQREQPVTEEEEKSNSSSPTSPLSQPAQASQSPPTLTVSAPPSQVFSDGTATAPEPASSDLSTSLPAPSFISTAPPSFVTPAPTIEGATTTDESLGRAAGQSWSAERMNMEMHERTGGTWKPT